MTYFVRDIILGPTVLAKTVGPAGFVFPICNSVGVFLRKYVNSKHELGIYTGTSCCIVKLPDEVCASHTKRVGEI